MASLRPQTLLLDGEVVIFDGQGVSRFQLLQELKSEPQYAAFDCLYKDGLDLRHQPLMVRRTTLDEVAPSARSQEALVFASAILAPNRLKTFELTKPKGYEGVVAKDTSAPYIEGRSNKWLKFKTHREDEFIGIGYTAPAGSSRILWRASTRGICSRSAALCRQRGHWF